MSVIEIVITLCFGMLLFICIAYLSFIDYTGLLVKVFSLPKPKDFDEYRKFLNHYLYKKHKKKWRRLFSCNAFIYAAAYLLITWLMQNETIGFLFSLFCGIIGIGFMGNIEKKQREKIQKQVKNNLHSESKK